MRKQIAIFIICLLLPLNTTHAAPGGNPAVLCYDGIPNGQCQVGNAVGCYYDNYMNACYKCPPGYYCTGDNLKRLCNDTTFNDFPYTLSDIGANSINQCYMLCETSESEEPHGTLGPCTPDDERAYYPADCNICLLCETNTVNINGRNVTNLCDSYFEHNGSCQPRWTTTRPASADIGTDCTDGADIKYYIRNDAGKFDCYANTCENYDEYEFVTTNIALTDNGGFVCSINNQFMNLGKCIKKEINCSDTTEIQQACTAWQTGVHVDSVQVGGTAQLQNGQYDYSTCTCTTDNYPIYSATEDEIGQQRMQCNYDVNSGTFNNQTCRHVSVTSCKEKYCVLETNQTTCTPTPAGYFSADEDTSCDKCPAGTTSSGANASINECGIKLGDNGTKFCDSVGCFNLPGSGIINSL